MKILCFGKRVGHCGLYKRKNRIGTQEYGVGPREFHEQRIISRHGMLCRIIVFAITSYEHDIPCRIGYYHRPAVFTPIAEHIGTTYPRGFVIYDRIAFERRDIHRRVAVQDCGPRRQISPVCNRVVRSLRGDDRVVGSLYASRTVDVGYVSVGVVFEFLGQKPASVFSIEQYDIIAETGHFRRWRILAIARRKDIHVIFKPSSHGIPSDL